MSYWGSQQYPYGQPPYPPQQQQQQQQYPPMQFPQSSPMQYPQSSPMQYPQSAPMQFPHSSYPQNQQFPGGQQFSQFMPPPFQGGQPSFPQQSWEKQFQSFPEGKEATGWLHQYAPSSPNSNLVSAFQQFDVNRNGYLSPQEVSRALNLLGESYGDISVEYLMGMFDLDHNNVIDFREFTELWGYLQSAKQSFSQHDVSRSGSLDYNQATNALERAMPILNSIPGVRNIVPMIFKQFDPKNMGRLNFDSFLNVGAILGILFSIFQQYQQPGKSKNITSIISNSLESQETPHDIRSFIQSVVNVPDFASRLLDGKGKHKKETVEPSENKEKKKEKKQKKEKKGKEGKEGKEKK